MSDLNLRGVSDVENEGKGIYVFEPQKRSKEQIEASKRWVKETLAYLRAEQARRGVKNW